MSDILKNAEAAVGPAHVVDPDTGSRNPKSVVYSSLHKQYCGTVQQDEEGRWVFRMNFHPELPPSATKEEAVELLRTAWVRYVAGKLLEEGGPDASNG